MVDEEVTHGNGGRRSAIVRSLPLPLIPLTVLILAATLFLVLLPSSSAAEVTWGDTNISGAEQYSDLTINLDGNLTVEAGGLLTINDSTLLVRATSPDQYMITVEQGGTMVLNNVMITSSGGTYGILVKGDLTHDTGSIEGLSGYGTTMAEATGLVVEGTSHVNLSDVDVFNEEGYALFSNTSGTVRVIGGSLHGLQTAARLTGGSEVILEGTTVRGIEGSDLIVLVERASLFARQCTFRTNDVESTSEANRAVHLIGDGTYALLEDCTIRTPELARTTGGELDIIDCSLVLTNGRPIADLVAVGATVVLDNLVLDEIEFSGGTLWLYDVEYDQGNIIDGAVLNTVGNIPHLDTLGEDVVVHHHYWVDFILYNVSGVATSGISLNVLTADGELVLEAFSGVGGYVPAVAIRAWTLDGNVFEYEPSHRVEFAAPNDQITNLQIFGNITVTLRDLEDSLDLVLTTSSIRPSTSAPRENSTFDLIVDGEVLIPYPWDAGQTFIDLYVDDEFVERQVVPLTSRENVRFRGLNLSAGQHLFRIEVDPNDDVEEMNEDGNNVVGLVLDVAPGSTEPGDLVDLTIWIDMIVDTQGNDGDTLIPGVINVDYWVRVTNSKTWLRNVLVAIEIDGAPAETQRIDLVTAEGEDFVSSGRFILNLPRGQYVFTVIVDPENEIEEEFEHNNEDSRTVTLDPEANSSIFDLDPACCSAIVMVVLIATMSIIGQYSQRRQRRAQQTMVAETVEYPSSTYGGSDLEPSTVTFHSTPRDPSKVPTSLDDQWTVQSMDDTMVSRYGLDGSDSSSAERITMYRAPPATPKERYKATNLSCPRCNGRDIVVFPDGSAKCQSCKKIFYPGRRYG